MNRTRATLTVVLFAGGAAALLWAAVYQDESGAAQNLIADVLVAAVATVAFREFVVGRTRRQFKQVYADDFDLVLMLLDSELKHFREVEQWSSRQLPRSDERAAMEAVRRDLRLDGAGHLIPRDTSQLALRLERLAADYGTVDFSGFLAKLETQITDSTEGLDAAHRVLEALHDTDLLAVLKTESDDDRARRLELTDVANGKLNDVQRAAAA
jgi:hypothetical protein